MSYVRLALLGSFLIHSSVFLAQTPTPKNDSAQRVYTESEVTRPAKKIPPAAQLQYPDSLRAAGIGGIVLSQWVVDTAGKPEIPTLEILKSPHPAFSAAVRTTVSAMHFSPALLDGHAVKQLVQMSFTFKP